MNTAFVDTKLAAIVAAAQTNGFRSCANQTFAPGCVVSGKSYNAPSGRGIIASCVLTSTAGKTVRQIHFGPKTQADIPWNPDAVKAWSKQIVYDSYRALPLAVRRVFVNDFGNLDTLLSLDMLEDAKALIANLELPESLKEMLVEFHTLKNGLVFALTA